MGVELAGTSHHGCRSGLSTSTSLVRGTRTGAGSRPEADPIHPPEGGFGRGGNFVAASIPVQPSAVNKKLATHSQSDLNSRSVRGSRYAEPSGGQSKVSGTFAGYIGHDIAVDSRYCLIAPGTVRTQGSRPCPQPNALHVLPATLFPIHKVQRLSGASAVWPCSCSQGSGACKPCLEISRPDRVQVINYVILGQCFLTAQCSKSQYPQPWQILRRRHAISHQEHSVFCMRR